MTSNTKLSLDSNKSKNKLHSLLTTRTRPRTRVEVTSRELNSHTAVAVTRLKLKLFHQPESSSKFKTLFRQCARRVIKLSSALEPPLKNREKLERKTISKPLLKKSALTPTVRANQLLASRISSCSAEEEHNPGKLHNRKISSAPNSHQAIRGLARGIFTKDFPSSSASSPCRVREVAGTRIHSFTSELRTPGLGEWYEKDPRPRTASRVVIT